MNKQSSLKKLKILSLDEAILYVPSEDTIAIRIKSTSKSLYPNLSDKFKSQQTFYFDDVDIERQEIPTSEQKIINPEIALSLVKYVDANIRNIEELMIHCYMGIRRSAATGLAIVEGFGLNIDTHHLLNPPKHYPNVHVYKTILNTIGQYFNKPVNYLHLNDLLNLKWKE